MDVIRFHVYVIPRVTQCSARAPAIFDWRCAGVVAERGQDFQPLNNPEFISRAAPSTPATLTVS